MEDIQSYNQELPSIFASEQDADFEASQKDQESSEELNKFEEPATLTGSELLKDSIGDSVKKTAKVFGKKAVRQATDEVSKRTGVDLTKAGESLSKGDVKGAFDKAGKAVGKKGKDLLDKAGDKGKDLLDKAGDKVKDLKTQAGDKGKDLLDKAGDKGKDLLDKAGDKVKDLKTQADDKLSQSELDNINKFISDKAPEKLGKSEIGSRINNLDDDLKKEALDKWGQKSEEITKNDPNYKPTDEDEENMRKTGQKLMEKGEKKQAKRDSGDKEDDKEDNKEDEDDDDDDEMPLLEDQDGNIITTPGGQADRTPTDEEYQDLYDQIKGNLEGETSGEETEIDELPKSNKPVNEPNIEDDFDDEPQGLLNRILGKSPKSKFVGTDQDPEVELQTKADQAQQKAEAEALRKKYNPPKVEDPEPPSAEDNPFSFDTFQGELEKSSKEASQRFVDELTSNKDYIPPSQQTGGEDATQLEDDAGFQRGSQKIPAKKEVKKTEDDDDFEDTGDDKNPFPPPKPQVTEDDDFEDTGDDKNPFPPPSSDTEPKINIKNPFDEDTKSLDDVLQYGSEKSDMLPNTSKSNIEKTTDTETQNPLFDEEFEEDAPKSSPEPISQPSAKAVPATNEVEQANTEGDNVNKVNEKLNQEAEDGDAGGADPKLTPGDDDPVEDEDGLAKLGADLDTKFSSLSSKLSKITEASVAEDEDPFGIVATGVLGLTTLLTPLFTHAKTYTPQNFLNPSSQFGA